MGRRGPGHSCHTECFKPPTELCTSDGLVSVQAVAFPQNRCYYFISGETEARQEVGRIGNLPKIPQLSDKIRTQTGYVSFYSTKQTNKQTPVQKCGGSWYGAAHS